MGFQAPPRKGRGVPPSGQNEASMKPLCYIVGSFHLERVMLQILLLSLACVSQQQAGGGGLTAPRVALIHGQYDACRHREDYDSLISALDWEMEKIPNEEFLKALRREDSFDLILGTALYNYEPVADWAKEAEAWLGFMARGGAVLLTDTNYDCQLQWLRGLGPQWEISVARCEKKPCWTRLSLPEHPLVHGRDKLGSVWAHLSPGPGYDVIARDNEGWATLTIQGHGRGYLLLSCHWPLDRALLEAAWDLLRQRRAGLEVRGLDWNRTAPGRNEWRCSLCNLTDTVLRGEARMEVSGPCGFALSLRESVRIPPSRWKRIVWKGSIEERGMHGATFFWEGKDGSQYVGSPASITIPPPVEMKLRRPGYRGALYEACPVRELDVRVWVTPYRRKGRDYRLRLAVEQTGAWRVTRNLGQVHDGMTDVRVTLPALPTGELKIDGVLDWARGQAQQRLEIPWVEKRDPQVVVGPALQLLRNGEPYFPVGIYHVPRESLKEAAELGFNCCQGWGTDLGEAGRFLDEASERGMTVLLECSAFLRQGELEPLVQRAEALKDHPALLAWYVLDEPADDKLALCREALERLRECDPDHPVYLVSCRPSQFAFASEVTDILGVDPYPIPRRGVDVVAAWMQKAGAATGGRKPVWLIPQLHNPLAYKDPSAGRGPTPAEERCMVYMGLILGAKGIVYYPWDDGPCGLLHDPDLMEAVSRLNREVVEMSPYLLIGERKAITCSEPEDADSLHGARFDLGGRCLVLLCNPSSEEVCWTYQEGLMLNRKYGEGTSIQKGQATVVTLPGLGTWAAEGAL